MNDNAIIIQGGKSLHGHIPISGAKNAALPGLAAAVLTSEPCTLERIPEVEDILSLLLALQEIGGEYSLKNNRVEIQLCRIRQPWIPPSIAKATRASILLLGPLVTRHGYAKVAFPGGCPIGERKINYHLDGLERMGARIVVDQDAVIAEAGRLHGIEYLFPAKTVTGTENLLMAASLAKGKTILHNCALEPEIADLCSILEKMGASIEGKGSETLIIHGQDHLSGFSHRIIPDRIEAGTYLLAGCFRGNEIEIGYENPDHIRALIDILEEMGYSIQSKSGAMKIQGEAGIRPVQIETAPFPGFPTDLQAQLTTLLTQVEGRSFIRETIFNDRFRHVAELSRLGAAIEVKENVSTVTGRTPLKGTTIRTTDLRASAALVLAGLIAEGTTVIHNSYQLLRGYEKMQEKLQKVGAHITIESTNR